MGNCLVGYIERFWKLNFSFDSKGSKRLLWLAISVLALLSELLFHNNLRALPEAFHAQYVTVFYNVKSIFIGDLPENIGFLLIAAAVGRSIFSTSVGVLDLIFYKKITGRNFNYEAMVTIAIVNLIFLLTLIFSIMNPFVLNYLGYYSKILESIPTLINLNGIVALLVTFVFTGRIAGVTKLVFSGL